MEVSVLSSVPHITQKSDSLEINTVTRIDNESSKFEEIVLNRPNIVAFFTEFMGGVDLL